MTTIITYLDDKRVQVASRHGLFVCDSREINRHHEGVWSDAVMCFIPKAHTTPAIYGSCNISHAPHTKNAMCHSWIPNDDDTFSDGTPVAPYDDIIYNDHSGIYFEHCVVCGIATGGDRYCGTACEQADIAGCV